MNKNVSDRDLASCLLTSAFYYKQDQDLWCTELGFLEDFTEPMFIRGPDVLDLISYWEHSGQNDFSHNGKYDKPWQKSSHA